MDGGCYVQVWSRSRDTWLWLSRSGRWVAEFGSAHEYDSPWEAWVALGWIMASSPLPALDRPAGPNITVTVRVVPAPVLGDGPAEPAPAAAVAAVSPAANGSGPFVPSSAGEATVAPPRPRKGVRPK